VPDDLIPDRVPRAAALVRDFVNTLDHELRTDELDTAAGLAGFLVREGLLKKGVSADEREREEALRLRRGLHEALELNHSGQRSALPALDEVLASLPVRLTWTDDGVVAVPADGGVAGALTSIGLAAQEARAHEVWWRLKICAFDECEWAYYDQSKNRSRSYCEYGCGNKLKTRAYRARRRAAQHDARS
jgi:predicted RNA-binding Zn ribbon-like protein